VTEIEVEPGVRLRVADLGRGDPVLLIPGIGLAQRVWQETATGLVDGGRRVVLVDQRGHGESDTPPDGYEISRLSADIVAVLDRLELERCALVGWSFGGQVALAATASSPGRVSQLVLVGSNGVRASRSEQFPYGPPADKALAALLAAEAADHSGARMSLIRSGFAEQPEEDLLDELVNMSLQMTSAVAARCYDTMLNTDLVSCLEGLSVPITQIMGDADPIHTLEGARWVQEHLEQGHLVELAGCGHYPMFEAPVEFNSALLNALGRGGSTARLEAHDHGL